MPELIRLSFPAKPDYLILARLALSGLARDGRIDEELVADLKLAVTEACGNAVRHAYPEGDAGEVTVSYLVEGTTLTVVVEDQGTGIAIDRVPNGLSVSPTDGGMGLSLMRAIADDLQIGLGADGRGTVVQMTKSLEQLQA